jgi:hypothetical protein
LHYGSLGFKQEGECVLVIQMVSFGFLLFGDGNEK